MKPSKFHSNRRWYNWLAYEIGDKFLEKYSKYYKGRLVDLGGGEAPYKEFFLQYADEYIGVDWTNTIHNSKADIVSNLNEKIELPNEYAYTLVSLSVMEHLCEPQVFFTRAIECLRGGNMIIQVPWQWWIHKAPHDYFRYTPYALRYMSKKAGFVDVMLEPQSVFFTMWLFKLNYFTLRFIRCHLPFRLIIKSILWIMWNINQILVPFLDKLDRHWEVETSGYFLIAKKL